MDFGGYEHYGIPDHTNVHADPKDWALVGLMVVATIGQIVLAILLFPKFRQYLRGHATGTSKIVIISALTNFILPIASILSITTTVLVLIYSDFHHQLYIVDVASKLTLCLYLGCQTLMILIFTLRIDGVFSNTPLAYPPHVVTLLRASCVIFTSFYLFVATCRIFELWSIFEITAIVWIVLYFCLSVILCILFIRKVEALMLATVIDEDMIHIILKSSILITISISSSVLFFLTWIVIEFCFTPSKWHPAGIFWTVVDCTVSAFCLFLLFVSNDNLYRKSCRLIHHYFAKKETMRIDKKSNTRSSATSTDKSKSNSEKSDKTENTTIENTCTCTSTDTNMTNSVIISSVSPATMYMNCVELMLDSTAVKTKVNTEKIDSKLEANSKSKSKGTQ